MCLCAGRRCMLCRIDINPQKQKTTQIAIYRERERERDCCTKYKSMTPSPTLQQISNHWNISEMSKVVASCRIHIDVNCLLNGKGCWSKPGCISINLSPVKPPNIIYHTWRPDKKGRRNLGMMMMKNILNKPTKQKCLIKQALPRKQHKRKKQNNDTSTQSQLNSAIQHTLIIESQLPPDMSEDTTAVNQNRHDETTFFVAHKATRNAKRSHCHASLTLRSNGDFLPTIRWGNREHEPFSLNSLKKAKFTLMSRGPRGCCTVPLSSCTTWNPLFRVTDIDGKRCNLTTRFKHVGCWSSYGRRT